MRSVRADPAHHAQPKRQHSSTSPWQVRRARPSCTVMLTMHFNGIKVHTNQAIGQVFGGANSGIDGGNDGGKGFTDTLGGLKLRCEGDDARCRNAWIIQR